ncbi:MAG TPA: outer membrane beta-barrel protein [Mariprofundaceae bacterium]|nr:outer membrane beta-barrel protein [Mariprofundaceae bacterium]
MINKTIKLIIAGVILTLSTSAYALAGEGKFNGFYGGINYSSIKSSGTALSQGPTALWETPGTSTSYSKTKDAIGGQVGYQTTFNSGLLVGAELAYTAYQASGVTQSPTYAWHKNELTVKNIVSLSGRVGYVYNSWLVYGKAGVSEANIQFRGVDVGFPQNYYILSKNQFAANLGVGAEYCFDFNVSLGVEYSHIDWGSFSGIAGAQVPVSTSAFGIKAKSDITSIRLNYLF